jgi:hypothetical protein
MAVCEHCGNEYDKSFQVIMSGKTHNFDSFECAIHVLAPSCAHCGVDHGDNEHYTRSQQKASRGAHYADPHLFWSKADSLIAAPTAHPSRHYRGLPVHSAQRRTQAANP